jgi:hypothetical protein
MNGVNFSHGLEEAWTNFATFMPKLLLAAAIIIVGYFIARALCGIFNKVLYRIGFNRLTERGGINRVLSRTDYKASDLLAKVLFYAIMLFVLQFAFGIFGTNPISSMLTAVIAFLPKLFAAVLIVIVASAIAAAAKDILQATLGALSYGRVLANLVAAFIVGVGIFAALSQINIAPAIVNGIFYAGLAIVAGSAIVAIGGGGIAPMRRQWERALGRMEEEAPRLREHLKQMPNRAQERSRAWKEEARTIKREGETEQRGFPE